MSKYCNNQGKMDGALNKGHKRNENQMRALCKDETTRLSKICGFWQWFWGDGVDTGDTDDRGEGGNRAMMRATGVARAMKTGMMGSIWSMEEKKEILVRGVTDTYKGNRPTPLPPPIVQCCNILPSLVSSMEKIWECDLCFSLPLFRGFDHSCGAGNPTSKWGGFPGGRGRPSLILRYQRWRGVGGLKSDFQVGLIVISNWNINFDNPSLQWHTHTFAGLV